jgi:hypothetical protein
MSKILLEQLDNALDDIQMSHVHFENIDHCVNQILNLKNEIKEKEKELISYIDKLCADLSTEIRKLQPNLSVSIKTGMCEICYRTKSLFCCVKPYDNCWDFNSNDFGMVFSKRFPECRKLSCEITKLAECIVSYFNNHYRSLA